uniref:Uncharacterized protein n=1 Tax=Oryza brachyantha TaxID=4533 RepID=J3L3W8_ORYBR
MQVQGSCLVGRGMQDVPLWVQWPSWERTTPFHCSGWAHRNNEKGEKDVKVLMDASPVV